MDHVRPGRIGQGSQDLQRRKEAALTGVIVRCESCQRTERWTGSEVLVEAEGGRRRPDGEPRLAAWRTLKRSLEGELGPVVGRCAACDQPLVAEGDLPRISWTIELPDGVLEIERSVREEGHPVDIARADERIRRLLGEPIEPGKALFSGAMLTSMLVPFAVWATAFFIVVWFLYNVLLGTVGF